MKRFLSILLFLAIATSLFGATAAVTKDPANNRIKEDLSVGSGRTVRIESGGTLQADSGATLNFNSAASNQLFPTQSGQSGKVLSTNGTNPQWVTLSNNGTAATASQVVAGSDSVTYVTPEAMNFVTPSLGGRAPRGGVVTTGASNPATTQGNSVLYFGTSDLSFGGWFRAADWTPSEGKVLIDKDPFGAYINTDGTIRFGIGGTTYSSTVATGVADGAWALIVVTIDRDGNATFYINGVALGTTVSVAATSATSLTSDNPLRWGANAGANGKWVGTLSETFLINGLVSATQVADIYRAGTIAPIAASFTFYQWLDFGQGYGPILRDRSGQNQHALMGASGLSHAIPRNPPGIPQRAPRTALVGDGTNGTAIRTTLNTQNPLTGDFTWWWDGVIPSDASATAKALATLHPSTTADAVAGASSLTLAYSTGAGIYLYFLSSDTASSRYYGSVSALTLLAGKRCLLVARRSSSGMKIFLGLDGDLIDATYLFSETTGGASPPAWTANVDGQYLRAFDRTTTNSSATSLYGLRLANVAMTEAQLRTEYERGEPGLEWTAATKAGLVTGDNSTFASDTGFWSKQTGVTIGGGVCSFGGTTVTGQGLVRNSILTFGRRYRITFTISNRSAGGVYFEPYDNYVAYSANGTYVVEFTATFTYIKWGVTADGSILDLDNVTLEAIGWTARLRTDTAAGLTALNGSKSSTNDSTDFLLSTSGVTTSPDGRTQTIRFSTSTNGNQQLFGAAVIDTAQSWRIRSWTIISAGTPTVSLGNASAGTQYANAIVLANGPNEVSLSTRFPGTASLWCASNSTAQLDHVVVLDRTN